MRIELTCPRCGRKKEYDAFSGNLCSCRTPYLIDYPVFVKYGSELSKLFASRPKGVWRYLELLPPTTISPISMGEGGTYFHHSEGLGRQIGLRKLYIKNEATNPTGAFTDRGASIELTKIVEIGVRKILCVAAGNLAVSIAGYSAKAGIPCSVYLKHGVEQVKILQALAYDAEVYFTNDPQITIRLLGESSSQYIVTSLSPLLIEGYKTCILEILEQFDWNSPDWVSIPIGSGSHITACWKALRETEKLDLVKNSLPKILGGQISSCAPIAEAFMKNKEDAEPLQVDKTIFPEISDPSPAWAYTALRAVRELGGAIVKVDEEELMKAIKLLAKNEGILAEPASAVALASMIKAVELGVIKRDESVVYIVTGSGMKDPSIIKVVTESRNFSEMGKEKRIGFTKMKILELLFEKPLHGYAIQKELALKHGLKISLPTTYEHLRDL
ncbi:MAG: threonine synthase, partial [Nitrososphaerota archaeon]